MSDVAGEGEGVTATFKPAWKDVWRLIEDLVQSALVVDSSERYRDFMEAIGEDAVLSGMGVARTENFGGNRPDNFDNFFDFFLE